MGFLSIFFVGRKKKNKKRKKTVIRGYVSGIQRTWHGHGQDKVKLGRGVLLGIMGSIGLIQQTALGFIYVCYLELFSYIHIKYTSYTSTLAFLSGFASFS